MAFADKFYKYDKKNTVDLLVLYGPEVKARWGGPDGVLAHVDELVGYTNSMIKAKEDKPSKNGKMGRLRLAGLVEVDYHTVGDLKGDINNLKAGKIKSGRDTSLRLRDFVGADLVCVLSACNKRGGGGLASVHGPWSAINYPVGSIFAHEMRHNFGWNHQDKRDYTMIQRNYPGMAKWKRAKRPDWVYVQYIGTGDEYAPPAPEKK